jgi:hypothetical protein
MDESNHQIAQRGENLWGVARPELRTVLLKRDIADVMQPILNTPVTSDELE